VRRPEKVAEVWPASAAVDDLFLNFLFAYTHAGSNVYYTFALFKKKRKKRKAPAQVEKLRQVKEKGEYPFLNTGKINF
jgi:hypothetical protein